MVSSILEKVVELELRNSSSSVLALELELRSSSSSVVAVELELKYSSSSDLALEFISNNPTFGFWISF